MKLNNKGWGMSAFLIFSIVFLIAILVAAGNAYKLGLTDEKPEIQFNNNNFNYANVESNLKDAARRYVNSKEIKVNNNLYITVSELVKNGYMQIPVNNKNVNCSGYVKVSNKSKENLYEPYIKCGSDYQTNGYKLEFDK